MSSQDKLIQVWGQLRDKAGTATFAADKQRQLLSLQHEARTQERQLSRQLQALGGQVYQLYEQGELPQSTLQDACAGIAHLRQQQAELQRQIAAVQARTYQVVCPICDEVVVGESAVCPNCEFNLQQYKRVVEASGSDRNL